HVLGMAALAALPREPLGALFRPAGLAGGADAGEAFDLGHIRVGWEGSRTLSGRRPAPAVLPAWQQAVRRGARSCALLRLQLLPQVGTAQRQPPGALRQRDPQRRRSRHQAAITATPAPTTRPVFAGDLRTSSARPSTTLTRSAAMSISQWPMSFSLRR